MCTGKKNTSLQNHCKTLCLESKITILDSKKVVQTQTVVFGLDSILLLF